MKELDEITPVPSICHKLDVADDIYFYIYLDANESDVITTSIKNHIYSLPPGFNLLSELARPGQRILDLGAHIGTFSLFAAASGYEVLSVEASPRNVSLLRQSAQRNGFASLHIKSAAVGSRPGTLAFAEAGPYGFVATTDGNFPRISVEAVTVDGLLADVGWDCVDFIKMDIEGSEIDAIQGMTKLLSREDAPPILYESNGHTLHFLGKTPDQLTTALEYFGYRCYMLLPDQLIPIDATELQPVCNVDCLAVKGSPPYLSHWKIGSHMSLEERITMIVNTCNNPLIEVRAYIGRALSKANDTILTDWRVASALDFLAIDREAEVRAEVSWWQGSGRLPAFVKFAKLRQELSLKSTQITRLQSLVNGYERGRYIRFMKMLHRIRLKIQNWMG